MWYLFHHNLSVSNQVYENWGMENLACFTCCHNKTIAFSPPVVWDQDQYGMYGTCYTQNATIYSTDNKLRQGRICVSFLSLTDEGKNVFEIVYPSRSFLVTHNINVDEHGKKTVVIGVLGSYDILLFTRTRSGNISILTVFIHKIIVWWQYPLLSLQGLGLFVHRINDSGKSSTREEELVGLWGSGHQEFKNSSHLWKFRN